MGRKSSLQSQADKILEAAAKKGVQTNYFFTTTFNRYMMQLKILKELEKAIEEYGTTVTKVYVKGRENLMSNPAISEYNKTATAANGTVATLMNIIKNLPAEESGGLSDIMKGLMNE